MGPASPAPAAPAPAPEAAPRVPECAKILPSAHGRFKIVLESAKGRPMVACVNPRTYPSRRTAALAARSMVDEISAERVAEVIEVTTAQAEATRREAREGFAKLRAAQADAAREADQQVAHARSRAVREVEALGEGYRRKLILVGWLVVLSGLIGFLAGGA